MLIGDSLPNYLIIRSAILALRLIGPTSILYCILFATLRPQEFFQRPLPLPFSIWAIAESSFFLFVYLPLKTACQREVIHPSPPSKQDREDLFQKCLDNTPDPASFLSGWFLGANLKDIRRENVKEFYAWSHMNKKYEDVTADESAELDDYVDRFERKLGQEIRPGRGRIHGLRGTVESVYMQHRPLIWYLIVGLVDNMTSMNLLYRGFKFHREKLPASLLMLPTRPLNFFTRSPLNTNVSYWTRKHTAKNHLPIVFIHGIGVGLYAYTDFLAQLSAKQKNSSGTVGILAIEVLPISARLSNPALSGSEMAQEIRRIIDAQGWTNVVLAGHSYGTAIASTLLRSADFSKRVKAAVLMDPISFLLHLPNVAYNFTRRAPRSASEWMLFYFSSRDMMIAHTLARRFFWSEYVLWKEDLAELEAVPVTVTLSARDIVVPTREVWRYLTDADDGVQDVGGDGGGRDEGVVEWRGERMKVLWFEGFNHADLFSSKGARRGMAKEIRDYSRISGEADTAHRSGIAE